MFGRKSKSPKKGKSNPGQIDNDHLAQLGSDDRIAVMRMVAEGELSVDEAVQKVLASANARRAGNRGMKRQGAVKKAFRGRLKIKAMVVGPDKPISVLLVTVEAARDLEPEMCDAFVGLHLEDSASAEKLPEKTTPIRPGTKHPIFNEKFQWEIRKGEKELESWRLHIVMQEEQKTLVTKKKVFLGSFSFALAEIYDPESCTDGWFKLLDARKGNLQNVQFIPKLKTAQSKTSRAKEPLPPKAAPPSQAALKKTESKHAVKKKSPEKKKKSVKPPKKVTAKDFTFTKVLGRGSFGKVLLATARGQSDVFAIKVLKKTAVVEDDDVAGTMTEKRVLALSGGSPFLTRLHACFQTPASLYFVMEFVNGGDLMYHIQNERIFSLDQSRFYAMEILLGLWFLHEKGVVYRDLKLDNVMLEHTGHIKIADFGMCKERIFGEAKTTTFCGTPGYLAPEIIKELPYGASVDFWSLGVLCFEFLVGDSPFEADEDDELFNQICNMQVMYPARLDAQAKSFVDGLLNRNPETRLGCTRTGKADLMAHSFFKGHDWDAMAQRKIKPPFVPKIKNPKAAECFDDEFTSEAAVVTPIDKHYIDAIEQSEFNGFSFVNNQGAFGNGGAAEEEAMDDPSDLTKYKWYKPDLSRTGVVTLLRGKTAGAFCVRESASQPGCYALSVSVSPQADKLWTGLITPTGSQFRLFVKQKFDTIPELIDYYRTSPCVTIDKGKRQVMLVDV